MSDSHRKRAVILHADVMGSTALMQKDELLAHERIVDAFRRFLGTVEKHGGVACKIRGDSLLAEFSCASDSVTAAMEFHRNQTEEIEKFENDLKPELRVGIARGEVIVADNAMTGGGVVTAQRLGQLAK